MMAWEDYVSTLFFPDDMYAVMGKSEEILDRLDWHGVEIHTNQAGSFLFSISILCPYETTTPKKFPIWLREMGNFLKSNHNSYLMVVGTGLGNEGIPMKRLAIRS